MQRLNFSCQSGEISPNLVTLDEIIQAFRFHRQLSCDLFHHGGLLYEEQCPNVNGYSFVYDLAIHNSIKNPKTKRTLSKWPKFLHHAKVAKFCQICSHCLKLIFQEILNFALIV